MQEKHIASKASILLVDDQNANLLALEAALDELGQDLFRARSGEEALRLMLERDFAVVLLDVQMHGLDGFATAQRIREQERSRHTPIIFLTAYESQDFPIAKAYALGAVDYLVKPLFPQILRAKAAVFVELFNLREAERRERRSHLATQLSCAKALAEEQAVPEAVLRILRAVCEGLSWDWGAFWFATAPERVLRCTQVWRCQAWSGDQLDRVTRSTVLSPGQGLPGRVWLTGEPTWVPDVRQDPNFRRSTLAAQDGLHGAIAFPVAVSDEPLGVMEFLSRETRTADAETLQMLAAIGSQLGQFIHRKRAEEDLRRSRQELRDFVENATVGLHWVGPDGTILWANRAEHELLGYTREEYVGHHIAEFHADGPVIEDILRRLAQKEELNSYEAQLRCKDGSFRHVLISSNVLWDGERFCHTQCFTRDITERKRLEEALRQRADDMTEAARRKDQFLAMLAHELRNPLAPVLYGLRIMQVSDADQRTIENVRSMMERQLHHLTRLVDDLLDVSRITRGMVQVRRSGEGVRRSTDYPKQAG